MKRVGLILLNLLIGLQLIANDSIPAGRADALITGATMGILGTTQRFCHTSRFRVPKAWESNDKAATVFQFVPLASVWALKGFGVTTRSTWGEMAINQGTAAALTALLVYGTKGSVKATRPNGENERSFPSGHAAWSFMGATVVANELMQTSAWYPMGAYAIANAVSMSRVLGRHHLPADVMAGAGIGILATETGYIIGDWITGKKAENLNLTTPNLNSPFLTTGMGMVIPVGHISTLEGSLKRLPALKSSIMAGVGLNKNWGMAAELSLLSTPLMLCSDGDNDYVAPCNSVGLTVLSYYSKPLSQRISIFANAGAGLYRNLDIKSVNNAVTGKDWSFKGDINFGGRLRLTDNFSSDISVGYELSGYHFNLAPEPLYNITESQVVKGTSSAIVLNVSARYDF